jgi:hypothetical protein
MCQNQNQKKIQDKCPAEVANWSSFALALHKVGSIKEKIFDSADDPYFFWPQS